MGWLRNIFKGKPKAQADPYANAKKHQYSRDDAADSTRIHRDYWGGISDTSINALIQKNLSTWRARCRYEAMNNPIVKGMVRTYTQDVVGPGGPKLDIRTTDKAFNTQAEQLWESFWRSPDYNGKMSGADFLSLACRQLMTHGSYLWQIVTDGRVPGNKIQTRLKMIDSRRLNSGMVGAMNPNIILGIKVSDSGQPQSYYIDQPSFKNFGMADVPQEIPAKYIIHGFEREEPEQLTGIPWLKVILETCADRRQLNRYIIEAYKFAAAQAVYLFSKNPNTEVVTVEESAEIEPATMTTLPPGYEFGATQATQPTAQFDVFEKSLMANMGRPVGMPYGTVALDYSNLSFSAARLMMNTYYGGLRNDRANVDRTGLDYLLFVILAEAEIKGLIRIPNEPLAHRWTWPNHPSVDPKADAVAATERLSNLTTSLEMEAAANGDELDDVVSSHERSKQALEKIGINYPITKNGAEPEPDAEPGDNEDGAAPKAKSNGAASRNGSSNGNGRFRAEILS